jgi:ketosteroid isomerase-like protein
MNQMPQQTNIDTVKRLYDLFNKRQWQDIAELYSDTACFLDNRNDEFVIRTNEEIPTIYAALERKYPGITEQILYIEESGDLVYVQFLTSGSTRSGGYWQQIAWTIFTVENNKIAKVASYFNRPEKALSGVY